MPVKKGGHYFYTRNAGLQNQAVLFVRDGVSGQGRVLLDPNTWSKDGATALAEWAPREDGSKLAYAIQDGGTDWRTVKVLDVATGQVLADERRMGEVLRPVLGEGRQRLLLFALRRAAPRAPSSRRPNENQQVYFHSSARRRAPTALIYATPDQPKRGHGAQVTDDGKWLVITSTEGHRQPLRDHRHRSDQRRRRSRARSSRAWSNQWSSPATTAATFYWMTNNGAPRLRIVAMDVAAATPVRARHRAGGQGGARQRRRSSAAS